MIAPDSLSESRIANDGISVPDFPRARRRRWRTITAVVTVFLLIIGVIAAVLAAQTNFDLRQFAWGGVQFDQGILQRSRTDIGVKPNVQEGNRKTAELFTQLTFSYAGKADVVNLNVEDFDVRGVAFRVYNEELDSSHIFLRLENPPFVESKAVVAWLENDAGEYLRAGIGEYLTENGELVLYLVTEVEGNTDNYKRLALSFDSSILEPKPEEIFLRIDFNEEQT